ncbi:glycosyltransferase family 4 protein [Thalassoroseus pseudoceratinae]|uniref:glycosyltransferase family 4 protein n=1 Tax=Thalassoroseus pseudoceratinae TaxID=2713176 RepID=UPI00141F0552|nr:glycosyltransferase family 4 protein [Thalassoroseus pseudoceratinae]
MSTVNAIPGSVPVKTAVARPMFVLNSTQIGGGSHAVLTLLDELVHRRYFPTIVHPGDGDVLAAFERFPVENHVVKYQQPGWWEPLQSSQSIRRWVRLIRKSQTNVIYVNEPMTARVVLLAARVCRVPVVVHVHCDVEPAFARWMYRWMPSPNLFIFNSKVLREQTWPHFQACAPSAKAVVVSNGIDLQRFQPSPKSESISSASTRVPVGIIANLLPIKAHDNFLKMAAELERRGIAAEYRIIGDGRQEPEWTASLKSLCDELGLNHCVRFLGYRSDIPAEINELGVLVCCSHSETFGLCVAEAMACAKPVVATNVGGLPEVVENGVTGLLVPPNDANALADAVSKLLQDPEWRIEMGRCGRDRALRLFGSNRYAERILSACENLI